MPLVCCQLVRRGRQVVAEPHAGGGIISLSNGRDFQDDVGSLALVAAAVNVGRVIEVLGPEDDIRAALRGALADAGRLGPVPPPGRSIDEPSVAVERELAELGSEIPYLDEREDLRWQPCVTIDPPGAKDFDDAIHVEETTDGWRLLVHIADVAAYVPAGSALDEEARERAMSTYVPGMVVPMLPHALSSDLCSLRPGVDRAAVTVEFELDRNASVNATIMYRSIIRSARRLTYHDVDGVLDGASSIDPIIDEMIGMLADLTDRRHAARVARGALDLELPDLQIIVDGDTVTDAYMEPASRSHRLVEECMLLANEAVGDRLAVGDAPGIWRVHDDPDPDAVIALTKMYELLGVPTPALPELMSGRQAARQACEIASTVRAYAQARSRGTLTFVPRVLRSLKQARYDAQPGWHSGLAARNYAHFTSPIRRYPDLINHRSLLTLLRLTTEPPSGDALAAVAEHVSDVERECVGVERTANSIALAHRLYAAMYDTGEGLGGLGADRVDRFSGEVTGLISSGCFVRFGSVFEGFIPARTISAAERYDLDDAGLALVGGGSGHRITLGDAIKVRVDSIDRSTGKVSLRKA